MQPDLSHLYEATPRWLDVSFVATTALTVGILCAAVRQVSHGAAISIGLTSLVWLMSVARLAYSHFFQHLDARPPHFVLVIALPLLVMGGLFVTSQRRFRINQLPLSILTLLHTVRVPVELVLYALYVDQQVPQLMTFDGRNVDILTGLTAPIITYLIFWRKQVSVRWLLVWNVLALASLINIVTHAMLSAPFPVQQLAFAQPNVAILKAPYVWLPGYIVPAVLFSHVVVIQRLIKQELRHRFT